MHAAIYRADPRAQVIVHTHADCCTALGALGQGLPAFHYDIAQFGGDDVRLAPYALFGTAELAPRGVCAVRVVHQPEVDDLDAGPAAGGHQWRQEEIADERSGITSFAPRAEGQRGAKECGGV